MSYGARGREDIVVPVEYSGCWKQSEAATLSFFPNFTNEAEN